MIGYDPGVTVPRLALLSGFLFVGISIAGALIDHFITPSRSMQSSLERSVVFAGIIVVSIWLSLPVKGVTLR